MFKSLLTFDNEGLKKDCFLHLVKGTSIIMSYICPTYFSYFCLTFDFTFLKTFSDLVPKNGTSSMDVTCSP